MPPRADVSSIQESQILEQLKFVRVTVLSKFTTNS